MMSLTDAELTKEYRTSILRNGNGLVAGRFPSERRNALRSLTKKPGIKAGLFR
jgi:hypothetical protein